MKRIIFIANSLGARNGADQSALDVLAVLSKRAYVLCDVLEMAPRQEEHHCTITGNAYRLPHIRLPGSYIDRLYVGVLLKRIVKDWRFTCILKRLKKQSYDLLISNEFSAKDIAYFVSAKKKVCILRNAPQTYQGAYSGSFKGNLVLTGASQYTNPVAVSKKTAELWDDEGIFEAKCRVIPNCAKEECSDAIAKMTRTELREKCHYEGTPIIVCVASIQYRKGQDLLLDVWGRVRAKFPHAQLFFVGPAIEDSWYAAFKHRMEKLDAGIVCVGAVDNPMEYICAADLFVLPSRDEALPRTILDSMLLKTPVVASAVAGISEMIVNGETGLLFDSENSDYLVEQVIKMLNNTPLQRKCVNSAYQQYWSHYSRSLFDKRWNDYLDEVL
jgi:glycosyltransferase involved in cell wall biosynthesis